jgi:hypothetical protein
MYFSRRISPKFFTESKGNVKSQREYNYKQKDIFRQIWKKVQLSVAKVSLTEHRVPNSKSQSTGATFHWNRSFCSKFVFYVPTLYMIDTAEKRLLYKEKLVI